MVKQTALIVAFLMALALMMAVPVLAHGPKGWSDCRGQVVTFTGPHHEPVECVCFKKSLATCFDARRGPTAPPRSM